MENLKVNPESTLTAHTDMFAGYDPKETLRLGQISVKECVQLYLN